VAVAVGTGVGMSVGGGVDVTGGGAVAVGGTGTVALGASVEVAAGGAVAVAVGTVAVAVGRGPLSSSLPQAATTRLRMSGSGPKARRSIWNPLTLD
jgi:hypothetical protein